MDETGTRDCKRCGGIGWVKYDVPINDSRFGKPFPCSCMKGELARRRQDKLREITNLTGSELSGMTFDKFDPNKCVAPFQENREKRIGETRIVRAQMVEVKRLCVEYAENPKGWLILQGGVGSGKCVSGDTLIQTGGGIIEIGKMGRRTATGQSAIGTTVDGLAGKARATAFYEGGISRTLRIRTRRGFSLAATPEHPLLSIRPTGAIEWVCANDLRAGDYVAIRRGNDTWPTEECPLPLPENSKWSWSHQITAPHFLDAETAWVFGALLGDGSLTINGVVSVTKPDKEVTGRISRWMASVGVPTVCPKGKSHGVEFRWYSRAMKDWLEKCGVMPVLSGDKTTPPSIFLSPPHVISAYLQGLFDTDGYAGRNMVEYASKSTVLAREVHLLLLSLGIVSTLSQRRGGVGDGQWRLSISGPALREFADRVGFSLSRKRIRMTKYIDSHETNPNQDTTPYLIPADDLRKMIPEGKRRLFKEYLTRGAAPSLRTLKKMAEVVPLLARYVEAQERFYWDEVTVVEDGEYTEVFDLTVPEGHSFVGNGFVCHNTHLACAIANEQWKNNRSAHYETAPDILSMLREGYKTDSFDERMKLLADIDLLVLDDLGAERGTDWAEEQLYVLLNNRYRSALPLVVTTNERLESTKKIHPRIVSRLRQGTERAGGFSRVITVPAGDLRPYV